MGVVQRFEERLERLVSGAFARAFRSAVQPVEIASALQREVDNSAQILSRKRRIVPNDFHVELSAPDHERLAPYGSTMADELAEMLREHAQEQGYVFTGPLSITFHRADDLSTGRFRVRSAAIAKVTGGFAPVGGAGAGRANLVLEVNGQKHPLEPPGLVVGRGADADLRINDPGISRRHVEFRVTPGQGRPQVSVIDLGSTNGVRVNGSKVEHAALEDGTTVKIGNTSLTVRYVGEGGSRSGV